MSKCNRRLVDEAVINAFAEISGDRNRLHRDDAYATQVLDGKCRGRIAHGALIIAFMSAYVVETFGDGTTALEIGALKLENPAECGDYICFSHENKLQRSRGSSELIKTIVTITREREGNSALMGSCEIFIRRPFMGTVTEPNLQHALA